MINFSCDNYWRHVSGGAFPSGKNVGKWMTYIRCDGFTTQEERLEIFTAVAGFLYDKLGYVRGKISLFDQLGNSNMVVMLFYAPDTHQTELKFAMEQSRSVVSSHCLAPQPGQKWRAATWNLTWKYDCETIKQLETGTHILSKRQ